MSLRRITFALSVGFLAIIVSVLFSVSQRVQIVEERLETIHSGIRHEQEKIRVLQAEWQYLIRPDRLEKLAYQYTLLRRSDGGEKIAFTRIPTRPPRLETAPENTDTDSPAASDNIPDTKLALQDVEDLHPEIVAQRASVRIMIPPKPLYKPGKTGVTLKQVSWRER